jgi:zinc protease
MSLVMALTFATVLTAAPAEEAPARIPQLPFEKYTLPNGLQVILHQDHSTPIVGVNIWYHVGSKNERPGRTGFAHLFEHMMFQGSKHYDNDYFGPLQKAGGRLNGSTSDDRTNYWETVPSNYLELALWMESDRMGFLLPAMTQAKLDNQRDVVRNERRQSYENRPYGLAEETISAAMYPPDHPYSWSTIGSMADLGAASRQDISEFFRRYYHPGNASLCIAGDFDPATAKRLVEKYFGPIPAGPKVEKLKPRPVALAESKRIRMTDRVGLPRLYMNWHTVPMLAPDDAELDVLSDVLAGGKTSRLYKALVREKQIAQEVHAYQNSQEIAGRFSIVVTPRQGHTLAQMESAVRAELARLEAEPPTAAEVSRAVNQFHAHLVRGLEPVSGFGGRADRLNMYNVFTGDPGYLAKDFERYLRVDPAGVRRVAGKYLGEKLVVLEVTPGKETTITPDPRAPAHTARAELAKKLKETPLPEAPTVAEDADRTNLPKAGAEPEFVLPPIHRSRLGNGMQVLVVEKHELPTVYLHVIFPFGRAQEPAAKLGLAPLLTSVWDEGTQRRSAMEIAEELAGIGASLGFSAGVDGTSARLFALAHHLPKALDVAVDVLQNPAFPEPELVRERNMAIGRLLMIRNEPNALAALAVAGRLYGQDHPYGKPMFGTASTLASITRRDLEEFYNARVRPERAAVVVVGDVTPKQITGQLERGLGHWKGSGSPAQQAIPAPPPAGPAGIVLIDKPGAAQSVISVALVGALRNSPDYFPLTMMDSIFGGQFSSRLNMNLRESKGYAYGAWTQFHWRVHQPGPFTAVASVHTAVTAPALVEILKEFEGMLGKRPVEPEELDFNKTYLTRGYPAAFETPGAVANQLETLVEYGLPDGYFNTFVPKTNAVTAHEVLAAAKKYLHLDRLAVIVVGDREKIEKSLRELPLGKNLAVLRFDDAFRLVPAGQP